MDPNALRLLAGNIGFLAILGKDIPAALQAFEYTVNQWDITIDTQHLISGVYFIKINSKQSIQVTVQH